MSRPAAKVLKSLRKHLPKGAKLVVAVSGGIDSVTLLHACRALSGIIPLASVAAAHLDHRFRKESGQDAAFVSRLCLDWGIKCILGTAGKPGRGDNLEAFGRSERYRFLGEVRRKEGADYILTAHTADDLAETFLMRLLANKEPRLILPFDSRRRALRPLLDVRRSEIESYAREHKLPFVTDPSNNDTRFLRNRVRHELLPLLRDRFDPRIVEVLSTRAQGIEEDRRALELFIRSACRGIERHTFGTKEWLRGLKRALEELSAPLQWRLAEEVFLAQLGFRLGRNKAKLLAKVLLGTSVGIELPTGVRLRKRGGGLVLVRQKG